MPQTKFVIQLRSPLLMSVVPLAAITPNAILAKCGGPDLMANLSEVKFDHYGRYIRFVQADAEAVVDGEKAERNGVRDV